MGTASKRPRGYRPGPVKARVCAAVAGSYSASAESMRPNMVRPILTAGQRTSALYD